VRKVIAAILMCLLFLRIFIVFIPVIQGNASKDIEWEQTFGEINLSEKGILVQQTDDEGYIILGNKIYLHEEGMCLSDIWAIKTNSNGNEEWNAIFKRVETEGVYSTEGKYIDQTNDEGYIIIGETERHAFTYEEALQYNPEIWLIKIDSGGNQEWNQTFSTTRFKYGQQTSDGGYFLAGLKGFWESDWVLSLLKTDEKGEERWNKDVVSPVDITDFHQTHDEGYLIALNSGNYKSQLLKIDQNGEEEWNETVDYYGLKFCKETTDGFLLIGRKGPTGSVIVMPTYDIILLETNSRGEVTWNKTIGRVNVDKFSLWGNEIDKDNLNIAKYAPAFSFQSVKEDGYVCLVKRQGYYPTMIEASYTSPLWVVKTDADYNEEWRATLNDVPVEDVQQTSDGNYILVGLKSDGGQISTGYASSDVWLMKVGIANVDSEESNNGDNEAPATNNENGTSGFEIICTVCTIALVSFWRRSRVR
jgi:hypothetical protein